MSTNISPILAQIPLDRNGQLSLYQQLRSAIEMSIIAGELPDGTALPSVRRLAAALDVAPITVVQAYRDLQAEQLVRSVPKRGYFVSVGPSGDVTGLDLDRVQARIDAALDAAFEAGLEGPAILRLVSSRLKQRSLQPPLIAVVGQRDAALQERVAAVAASLAELTINVIGLAFEDLETRGEDNRFPPLSEVRWFLVPVGETQRAMHVIGQHANRLVPMTRTLRQDVRDFIAGQPERTRFGIIAGRDDLIGRILAVLRRLHPLSIPPMAVAVDNDADVERVLTSVDALVVGSLAKRHLAGRIPASLPSIEFINIPDDRTIQRLRSRLLTAQDAAAS